MEGDREEDHLMRRACEVSLIVVPWFHVMGVIAFLDIQIMNGWTMIVSHRFDPAQPGRGGLLRRLRGKACGTGRAAGEGG